MILTNCAWLALDGAIVDKRSKLRMFWIIDASCSAESNLWAREQELVCVCVCVCGRQSICLSHSILSGAALIFHNKFQFEAFAFGIHMHTINFSLAAHFYLPIKIIPRQCCLYIYAAASVTTPCLLLFHLLLLPLPSLYNLLSALANCSAFKYKLFAFFPSAAGKANLRGE